MTWLKNEVLEGEFVRLEPMALSHIADLQQAVADDSDSDDDYDESLELLRGRAGRSMQRQQG